MLQFLLDEYLTGYGLDKRRVSAGYWHIDGDAVVMDGYGANVNSHRLNGLTAIRVDENHLLYILTDKGTEYLYSYEASTTVNALDKLSLYLM
jgi:hypothetical protein